MPSVFIVNSNNQYRSLYEAYGWDVLDEPDDADVIQFTGGADVNPKLYGVGAHPLTGYNDARDEEDMKYFQEYKDDKYMVGICRGAQFLHAANGGMLWQHVDGHATGRSHPLFSMSGDYICDVTSTHHQMMLDSPNPHFYDDDPEPAYEVIAVAHEARRVEGAPNVNPICARTDPREFERRHQRDIEVMAWYRNNDYEETEMTHLCFQFHPEYEIGSPMSDYFFQTIRNYTGLAGRTTLNEDTSDKEAEPGEGIAAGIKEIRALLDAEPIDGVQAAAMARAEGREVHD